MLIDKIGDYELNNPDPSLFKSQESKIWNGGTEYTYVNLTTNVPIYFCGDITAHYINFSYILEFYAVDGPKKLRFFCKKIRDGWARLTEENHLPEEFRWRLEANGIRVARPGLIVRKKK